ncbi:MAG: PASTA domain-containing protein [Pseudonocardiaceae bacterium]
MRDCPKCGLADPGAVDFCPNPQCRAYLGWASAAAPGTTPAVTPGTTPTVPPGTTPTVQMRPAPGPPPGPPQKRGVRVTIEPAELTVDPGSEVAATVTVRNLGTRVEEFRLMPRGPAAVFASITPTTLSVYPDDQQPAVVRFAPARGPQSPAGIAPFDIVARSAIHPDVGDVARGGLTVRPFENVSAVLTPEISQGRKPARHQVRVTNGGNAPVNTQVALRAQDGELTFEPPGVGAMLRPGATLDFPVLINGPRRWFGRTTRLPFSAVVTPASPQPPITLNGTRQQTAVFPWWVPTAALAVVALAIALYAVWPTPDAPTVPVIGSVDEATAVALLTDAQYVPDVIKAGDDTIAAGLAIRTEPTGGAELPHGEHVRLYISTGKCSGGPCPVEVPIVEGLPVSEAQAKLEDSKFRVRINRVASADRPVDRVIGSEPKATTLRPVGSEVVLTVSSGPPPGQPSPSPPSTPPPVTIKLPKLAALPAGDAVKVLSGLGLKPQTVPVHSNAVDDGQVLSTTPVADSKVDPGSEVTLTVARNTARVDLIATAGQAAWESEAGTLTFPGTATDPHGFVLVRGATLEDGSTAKVLETHPRDGGFVTGVYQLAQPAVPGDHVVARVGLRQGTGGTVTFVIKANGKIIKQVTDTADGKLKELDADLSSAKGATSIEITVLAGASAGPGQDWGPVWQDLRLEPKVG